MEKHTCTCTSLHTNTHAPRYIIIHTKGNLFLVIYPTFLDEAIARAVELDVIPPPEESGTRVAR